MDHLDRHGVTAGEVNSSEPPRTSSTLAARVSDAGPFDHRPRSIERFQLLPIIATDSSERRVPQWALGGFAACKGFERCPRQESNL